MNLIYGLVLAAVAILGWEFISESIRRARYRDAFAFGTIEHASARILGALLMVGLLVAYLSHLTTESIYLLVCVLLWVIYFISHNLEKALHPKQNGRRI